MSHFFYTGVKVYNISWGYNHKQKLLVELVSLHGIRSDQHDKRSGVRISTAFQLKWNIHCMCACTCAFLVQWSLV